MRVTTRRLVTHAAVWRRPVQQLSVPTSPASYVGCKRDTARVCCWAPCCDPCYGAVDRFDISRPPGPQQQTRPRLGRGARMDRQTDSVQYATWVRVCPNVQSYAKCTVLTAHWKASPYSIAERRVPELIPVLGSQPAGDVSHKPGGRLPLLSARPAVTPTTLIRAATNFAAWWTEAQWVRTVCLRLLPDSVAAAIWARAVLRLSPALSFSSGRPSQEIGCQLFHFWSHASTSRLTPCNLYKPLNCNPTEKKLKNCR